MFSNDFLYSSPLLSQNSRALVYQILVILYTNRRHFHTECRLFVQPFEMFINYLQIASGGSVGAGITPHMRLWQVSSEQMGETNRVPVQADDIRPYISVRI